MKPDRLNWNSLLLTIGFSILGYLGSDLYSELRKTHDAVLVLQVRMVPREEFDMQVTDIKMRMAAIEVEIQKIKERRTN